MSAGIVFNLAEALVATLDQAPVTLGSVTFEGHEVPSRISVGGAHAVAIHRLPGGGRVIDAMGVDDGAIAWSGFFTGPMAAARARLVDAMRRSGGVVGLSFNDYAFNVVVVHFEYDLQDRGALISYRIRTETLPTNVTQTADTASAMVGGLSDDIASANSALSGFGLTTAQAAVADASIAIASSGDPTSVTKLSVLSAALQASAGAIQSNITASGTTILPSGSGSSSITTAAALSAIVTSAGILAASVQASAYVNRSYVWMGELAGVQQGVPPISA